MIEISKIKKAREILHKEMKPYLDLGYCEDETTKHLAKKYKIHYKSWQNLLAFSKGKLKSINISVKISDKILEKS